MIMIMCVVQYNPKLIQGWVCVNDFDFISFNPSTEWIMHAAILSLLNVPFMFSVYIHLLRVSFSVYPSTVASLTKSLEAIIREPCGCFEQLSATTYPMVRLDVVLSFTD